MQWLKHMTDMIDDPKIRRLVRKHGSLGYAVYNLTIERIGKRLCTESPLPDLEETSEDLADLLNTDTVKVEEVMNTAISLGLFESDAVTGRVLCSKIYKFVDSAQTRSVEIKRMVSAYRGAGVTDCHGQSVTVTDCLAQNRTEQNRIEQKKRETRAIARHPSLDVPMNQTRYDTLITKYDKTLVDDYMERVKDWAAAKNKRVVDYAAAAANWLKRDGVEKKVGSTVPSRPLAPTTCPHCGGKVRSTNDEALCDNCSTEWMLRGGEWQEGT